MTERKIADLKARLALFEAADRERMAASRVVQNALQPPRGKMSAGIGSKGSQHAEADKAAVPEEEVFVPPISPSQSSEEE